jgi:transposase InsO family protein
LVHGLRAKEYAVGHRRVARLMREQGLHGKARGRFKPRTTDSGHTASERESVGSPVRRGPCHV